MTEWIHVCFHKWKFVGSLNYIYFILLVDGLNIGKFMYVTSRRSVDEVGNDVMLFSFRIRNISILTIHQNAYNNLFKLALYPSQKLTVTYIITFPSPKN